MFKKKKNVFLLKKTNVYFLLCITSQASLGTHVQVQLVMPDSPEPSLPGTTRAGATGHDRLTWAKPPWAHTCRCDWSPRITSEPRVQQWVNTEQIKTD